MASFWLFLSMALLGLLTAGGFKIIEHGASGENMDVRSFHANMDKWKKKEAGEGSYGVSQFRQKRQDTLAKLAKKPTFTVASRTLGMVFQEVVTSPPIKIMAPTISKDSSKNTALSKGSSKVLPESKTASKSKKHSLVTEVTWPWLMDVSSESPQMLVSAMTLKEDLGTPRPETKENIKSLLQTVTPSWTLLNNTLAASSQNLMLDSSFSTTTLKQSLDAARSGLNPKVKLPIKTAMSGSPKIQKWLDEITSTAPSQTLVEDLEFSTATQKHSFDSARPELKSEVKPNLTVSTSGSTKVQTWLDEIASTASSQTLVEGLAFSTVIPRQKQDTTSSGFSATIAQEKSVTSSGTNSLLGKCLLAVLLLALVASIFIVSTGVLATMLWRQKRAYRLSQANHTEMVCISSLLAAEEEKEDEEDRRRQKVKRVKLLGETGSETEADNLTLNSFLPDH